MPIETVDHVQLAMPAGGEPSARRFYCDTLGVPEVPKPADLALRGGCWFERGALKIHLGVEADFRPAHKAHPGFRASDLPALVERLRAGGWRYREERYEDGVHRVYVDDPFGNRIELLEGPV